MITLYRVLLSSEMEDNRCDSGLAPHKAMEILESESAGYDLQVLQTFYQHVAAYPIGTIVGLSSGLIGVVTGNAYG